MNEDQKNYVVILYENALDKLGETIKPYVSEVKLGSVIFCQKIEHQSNFSTLTIRPDQISPQISATLEIQIPSAFIMFVAFAFADVLDHCLIGLNKVCASNDSMT